ncbi:hypothetical protein SAY87_008809 [Trapa incisa]|uniref:Uncharacterized protein n=1 Tax=Trapa incisa TaxID=236973 RepID=A0AAN7JXQ9_9MYRT|nr:hypothetical protein SAY87_008809 [Trapa incisa]
MCRRRAMSLQQISAVFMSLSRTICVWMLYQPNMQQCFDLSAKLWDSETGIMKETSSRKASANGATPKKKRNSTKKISIPVAVTLSPPKSVKDEGNKADVATQASLFELHLESSLKDVVSSRFLRNGLSLIDSSQRKKWDEEWKKLTLTELDLAAERHLLLYQMIKMIKDAYKEA